MSVGWILFWKGVLVAILGGLGVHWDALKRRRAQTLILDKKTGRYVQDTRLETFEYWFLRVFYVAMASTIPIGYWLLTAR